MLLKIEDVSDQRSEVDARGLRVALVPDATRRWYLLLAKSNSSPLTFILGSRRILQYKLPSTELPFSS